MTTSSSSSSTGFLGFLVSGLDGSAGPVSDTFLPGLRFSGGGDSGFFFLISVGKILPLWKSSSADQEPWSKLSPEVTPPGMQKSKSTLELRLDGLEFDDDRNGRFSTGIASDWQKSRENEILGLMLEFSDRRSTAIIVRVVECFCRKRERRGEKFLGEGKAEL